MEYIKYILLLVAYLLGSIPTALILGKVLRGINIREHGSGNVGTTNVYRVLGFFPGTFCLIFDILKGALVILIIKFFKIDIDGINILFYGAIAIIGHVYPIFAKFKGGKAVATSLGVALAITPFIVLIGISVFIISLILFRYVSVSSTLAALCVFGLSFTQDQVPIMIFYGFVATFIVFRHRMNYVKLFKGTENKVFNKKK